MPRPGQSTCSYRGRADNELTRYRYDVVLGVGPTPTIAAAGDINWGANRLRPGDLAAELAQRRPEAIWVRGVPNARLAKDFALLGLVDGSGSQEDVASLRQRLDRVPLAAEHPETFSELGAQCGYAAQVGPSESAEQFDVLFSAAAAN